jgi:ATP phosphoribosyltransferase regulatory subunit
VLHTRPAGLRARANRCSLAPRSSATPGLEADLEAQELALDALHSAGVTELVIDLADARVLRGVLAGVPMESAQLQDVVQALSQKDARRWPS